MSYQEYRLQIRATVEALRDNYYEKRKLEKQLVEGGEKEGVEGGEKQGVEKKEENNSKKCQNEGLALSIKRKIEKLEEGIDSQFEILKSLEDTFDQILDQKHRK